MTEINVVIVSYNALDLLRRCLDSIFRTPVSPDFQVVVVDNASADPNRIRLAEEYPGVQFIFNQDNQGFSVGCNQGIRAREARFYLLLNPDTVVEDGAIAECLKVLQANPEVGILGCRVNNPDGTRQRACRRRIPRPARALVALSGLARLLPKRYRIEDYNYEDVDDRSSHEVEAVSGSFLMFRREVLETSGFLDEDFFLYGEDLDFCLRAGLAGWRVLYFPGATITHSKRASSSTNPGLANFHFYDAMRLFYLKHFAGDAGWLQRSAVLLGIRLLYGMSRIRLRLLGSGVGTRD